MRNGAVGTEKTDAVIAQKTQMRFITPNRRHAYRRHA
jgi:hypothetical protein